MPPALGIFPQSFPRTKTIWKHNKAAIIHRIIETGPHFWGMDAGNTNIPHPITAETDIEIPSLQVSIGFKFFSFIKKSLSINKLQEI